MSSRLILLDEWLFSHLQGEEGSERQRQAYRILEEIERRCDRIAWRPDTPWARKAYKLMKDQRPAVRAASRLLQRLLRDPQKGVIPSSSAGSAARSPEAWSSIPEEDRYLLEIYIDAGAELLVSTDQKLLDQLQRSFPEVRAQELEEFVRSYLTRLDRSGWLLISSGFI